MVSSRGMTVRQCGWLTLATTGLWLVLVWPVYRGWGRVGVEEISFSALLSLFPGWLVFWLVGRYGVAKSQALAVLAGTFLRMIAVLGGVAAIWLWRGLPTKEFLVWVALFYLETLAVETALILKSGRFRTD